jgi:hypothetical protein
MFSLIASIIDGRLAYTLLTSAAIPFYRLGRIVAVRRFDCLITARKALAQARASQPKELSI